MKYTLLEMTQEILSSMDSDEVNSITDTTEATQVARCIRQAYYDLIVDLDPPEHYTEFTLEEGGSAQPTLMTVPDDINSVKWIKYNRITSAETAAHYDHITFMAMDEFLQRMYLLSTNQSNVGTFNATVALNTVPIYYMNDRAPMYYTCLGDDSTIIFDSYDSVVETNIKASKTISYGNRVIDFALSDSLTPELDEPYFVRLLNEAKLLAFAELKSTDHAIANRNAKRSRNRSMADKFRIKRESDFDRLPNFSRIR